VQKKLNMPNPNPCVDSAENDELLSKELKKTDKGELAIL